MHLYKQLKHFITKHLQILLIVASSLISIGTLIYFMSNGLQNLGNYDAIARLNIARKIIDSLTPGIGQLGGVWLPFPQILMLPLAQSELLYRTGLAGAIVSGVAFVIAAVFIQRAAFLITKSLSASLLVWLMFVSNINILFLQTMALSESFFLMCFIMILYYLTKWIQTHSLQDLLATSIFIILITLTRYEGYFVFVGATIVVVIECLRIYKKESWQKVEGMVLLFLTSAGFGILLWCMYGFLFYNDFLHWLHLYSEGKLQVSTATQSVTQTNTQVFKVEEFTLANSFDTYTQVIQWMNGKIITFVGLFGFFVLMYTMVKKGLNKKAIEKYMPLAIISVVLFAFLIYVYQKGFIPPIKLPPQLISEEARKSFTIYSDSNIRYGIILAPSILLLAGFAAARSRILFAIVALLFATQLMVNAVKPQTMQYSLPILWPYSTLTEVAPFMSMYDRGIILISGNAHEDFMFQTGLPYSSFIYEGSREYWMESLNDPGKYADWVIFDEAIQGDTVYYFLTDEARTILQKDFDLVYDVDGFKVWKLH